MATATIYPFNVQHMDADAATSIDNDPAGFFSTGHFGTPQTNRAILSFDPTIIPTDAMSITGTLKITVSSNFIGANHTLNLYLLKRITWRGATPEASYTNYRQDKTAAWTTAGAGDGTNDRNATPIGSVALTAASSGTLTITLDATQLTAWLTGSTPYYGLLLQASDESGTTLMRWVTLDGSGTTKPQLNITYTPTAHALTDNILAYWPLSNTSYLDVSGNGHTLTPTNTPTIVSGIVGNAVHFAAASSQYLSNNDAALKLGNTDFTVCCWVKLDDVASLYTIIGTGDDTTANPGGFMLFYHQQSILDRFVTQLYNNAEPANDAAIADTINISAATPTPTATWLFLAVRHDSVRKYFQIYTDLRGGAGLVGPDSQTSHLDGGQRGPYPGYLNNGAVATTPTAPLRIGAAVSGAQYANAAVDEVGYWSRWLSVTEITAIRDAILAGNSYPFTANALSTVTGHAGDGTIVAAAVAQRVDFVGVGTTWTGGTPTITPSSGSLGAITVDTDTTCHANFTPTTSPGVITFTDTTDGTTTATLTTVAAATSYTLTGQISGAAGANITYTVALPASRAVTTALTFTPTDGTGGGTFTPTTVTLAANTTAPSTTFTYSNAAAGLYNVSLPNNLSLPNGNVVVGLGSGGGSGSGIVYGGVGGGSNASSGSG